jgi:hypothetical protein
VTGVVHRVSDKTNISTFRDADCVDDSFSFSLIVRDEATAYSCWTGAIFLSSLRFDQGFL